MSLTFVNHTGAPISEARMATMRGLGSGARASEPPGRQGRSRVRAQGLARLWYSAWSTG